MPTRFSTDVNPLSPGSIPVLVPRYQLCQPLPGIFFSKACVFFTYFFLHLLHQVSHDQVMCVFWQCHLSAPEQCSNTTHFLCYISRARWAWSFGCLKRILFLSSTPTFYERSDSLHNHFSTPKIDKNYAKSTSVHENTWKTEVQEGTIVLKYPQRACQRHCS